MNDRPTPSDLREASIAVDGIAMPMETVATLIDGLSKSEKIAEAADMLRDATGRFGIDHVSYVAMNIPTQRTALPLHAVTYSSEWLKHYVQRNYIDVDPVVRAGLGGLLPVDWSRIDRSNRLVARFFGEAQECKVGRQGLSFPIRGRHHEFGLFSVTSNVGDREWAELRPRLVPEMLLLAHHFHQFALDRAGVVFPDYSGRLSQREKDCLRWRATGKSDWDISQIMNISERTVKFHLENARGKLDSLNTTQAVAKALACGAIALY